jgi:hypothetical protein
MKCLNSQSYNDIILLLQASQAFAAGPIPALVNQPTFLFLLFLYIFLLSRYRAIEKSPVERSTLSTRLGAHSHPQLWKVPIY